MECPLDSGTRWEHSGGRRPACRLPSWWWVGPALRDLWEEGDGDGVEEGQGSRNGAQASSWGLCVTGDTYLPCRVKAELAAPLLVLYFLEQHEIDGFVRSQE